LFVAESRAQRQPAAAAAPDTTAAREMSGPEAPSESDASTEAVDFSARDSLVIRTDTSGQDYGTLHGEAQMSYQGASLKAETIEMNFQSSTLKAQGPPSDSAGGERALFEQSGGGGTGSSGGGQSFTGNVLSYNLGTKRGRVVAARTQRRDGYVEGSAVKVFEDSTLFVRDGTYTTCDCPPGKTPSYSLRSDEMKLSDRWVYTGPIQLFLFNVPTPLWLPFGFLPNISGRRSGPLPPQYGEDRRGFYLRNWGWYFALNPYTDLTIEAGVWSQGSYEIRPRFRYRKRYTYNGDLQLTYRRERIGEEVDPNFQNRQQGQLRWSHSQDLSPTASLNGDVNLVTSSDFARRNSDDYDDAVRQDISSSLNYRKRWPNGGRSFNISASQQQQFQNGNVNLTLPNLGFSQNSFKPFRNEQRIGDRRWYEKLTTSYQLDVQNSYQFRPRDPAALRRGGTPADSALADSIERADIDWYEALVDRRKYELATGNDRLYDFQATHTIPLNLTYRIDRYNLSLTPSIRYNSDWRINTTRRTALRDSTGGVGDIVERTEPGFYARHDFSTSLSSSSEVYGTFPIGAGPFQGLRHRLSPSLSMNYQPNFNAPFWGRTRPLRFADGTPVIADSATGEVRRYDILGGGRANRSTQQWSLNFSLDNVFETKRIRTDTTGQTTEEKITLLNLNVSGLSYNFAADSFRVGNRISLDARTSIEPFDISVRSSFSPYALRPVQQGDRRFFRRVDRLMIAESPWTPARLTDFQFNVGARFSSEESPGRSPRRRNNQRTGGGRRSESLSELNIPWSLDLSFNYGLRRPQKEITNRRATLSADFDLNVTSLWRVSGNTGYDFIQGRVATTQLSINRDLGCWNMSFTWVPFGRFQKYGFNLQVSSGRLSQLLQLQIPNKGGEGRLGGFGQQLRGAAQSATGVQGVAN
jgi:lipopolysaccharide assembly outer membrane protein LptD (OstA)